jgi:hypothetical protein
MRLFRPKEGKLLMKIKKKGYRTPSVSYMYPGHDEEFWVPSYASQYPSFSYSGQQHAVNAGGMRGIAAPMIQGQLASAGAVLGASRSPYDPPLSKKPKMGEVAMADDDAAALLTDLGRSSTPSSPESNGVAMRGNDEKEEQEYVKRERGMEVDEQSLVPGVARADASALAKNDRGAVKPYVYRPRRTPSQRPELFSSGNEGPDVATHANGSPVVSGSARAAPTQARHTFAPTGNAAAPGVPQVPPSPFHAPNGMAFGWPSAEVYQLYAQNAARPAFNGLPTSLDGSPPSASPASAFQAQQLQLLQAQQLYNAHLAQSGNVQALFQQQQLAQLALQQQLQAQAQAQLAYAQQQQQHQQQQHQQTLHASNALSASSELKDDSVIRVPFAVKAETNDTNAAILGLARISTTPRLSSSASRPKSPNYIHNIDIKEDNSMDADSGESIDTEDGYLTPRSASTTAKSPDDPLTLSEANAMSKRNKFFYKQLRDHLEYGHPTSPIGFVNDIFFLMDPKLHVGPSNRDGTFEKRVRLHFMEFLELKNRNTPLWLCWGTLLDSSKTPIFRRSSQFYRIPGNQSSVLKSHSRAPHDWDLADETSKQQLRNLALSIRSELDSKWDSISVASARSLVDGLKLALPTSPPLDEKGDYLPTPKETTLFKDLLENCLNRSPVPTTSSAALPVPSDARAAALHIWKQCGLQVNEEMESDGWSEEAMAEWSDSLEMKLAFALGVSDHAESLMKVFRLFIAPEGKMSFSELVLGLRRFGDTKVMFSKMIDLLATGAFNGNMSSAATRSFLNDQPDGAFLIRYSQSFPENFVLCSRVHGTITQINKIFNQPTAGLEIELEGRLCQVTQWASIIKSVPSMRIPVIAPEFIAYKQHGVPLLELLADRRFRISAEPFAALPASTRGRVDFDSSSSESSEGPLSASCDQIELGAKNIINNKDIKDNKELSSSMSTSSYEDSVSMARHELESKLVQERSADILSYLSKLRAQSRIAPTLFQEWCLFVSSVKSKEITSQLHSLLLAFREEPDLWIAFANEVIPRKVLV